MEQADLELQLKVWKELAISKQVLMRSAAEALKLDPDCTQEELKVALESVTARIARAEATIVENQQKAKITITVLEQKLASTERALATAEASLAESKAAQDNYVKSMAIERASSAQELQRLKDRVAEKDKAIKAINTALADTPENVLRKMNALKKQRLEEAEARRQVEASLAQLRKDKQTQDKLLASLKEDSARLVTRYRELHEAAGSFRAQLTPLVADAAAVTSLPEIDTKLIESIESPEAKPEAKASGRPEQKNKK